MFKKVLTPLSKKTRKLFRRNRQRDGLYDQDEFVLSSDEDGPVDQLVFEYEITDSHHGKRCLKAVGCFDVERISSGAFGTVFSCQASKPELHHIDTGVTDLACKVYIFRADEADYKKEIQWKSFESDYNARLFRHPHILKIYSCFQVYENVNNQKILVKANTGIRIDDPVIYSHLYSGVFMEKLSGTSETVMQKHPDFVVPEEERKLIFKQIGDALCYLHSELNVCHLDIKADNVGVIFSTPNVYKLIDFGNARAAPKDKYVDYCSLRATTNSNPYCRDSQAFARLMLRLSRGRLNGGPVFKDAKFESAILSVLNYTRTIEGALKSFK